VVQLPVLSKGLIPTDINSHSAHHTVKTTARPAAVFNKALDAYSNQLHIYSECIPDLTLIYLDTNRLLKANRNTDVRLHRAINYFSLYFVKYSAYREVFQTKPADITRDIYFKSRISILYDEPIAYV
jgi:hypothetical protein